jgi:CRISPR-associated protein Csx3
MNLFPAVFIGGPPQVGKSVLVQSLSQALHQRRVQHYVLRVSLAGENDWASEREQELVRVIRTKSDYSPVWIERLRRDIARRHLPLLLDVGGQLAHFQEVVLEECTHAILLTKDDQSRASWRELLDRRKLPLMADLNSQLVGESVLTQSNHVLLGTITGLERGMTASGPVFKALVKRLSALFAYHRIELYVTHLSQTPVETVIELERVARSLGIAGTQMTWEEQCLPRVLEYLPRQTSLGLYDRAPCWLYAALALHAYPAPLYQFDVCLGWVRPPLFYLGTSPDAPFQVSIGERGDHNRVEFALPQACLDYSEADGLTVPRVPFDRGVVLSGELPLWLWTGLALAYRPALWLAVQPPHQHDQAVVVRSAEPSRAVGSMVYSPRVIDTSHTLL